MSQYREMDQKVATVVGGVRVIAYMLVALVVTIATTASIFDAVYERFRKPWMPPGRRVLLAVGQLLLLAPLVVFVVFDPGLVLGLILVVFVINRVQRHMMSTEVDPATDLESYLDWSPQPTPHASHAPSGHLSRQTPPPTALLREHAHRHHARA